MKLAPEILKMRDALLDRIGDKPLKEVAEIVNEILLNETNNINRLAALSARVQVLRSFSEKEYGKKSEINIKKINKNKEDTKSDVDFTKLKPVQTSSVSKTEAWVRVEMLKSGIVNGVRFPEGVVIDVSQSDATDLEKQALAKIIEVIDNNETPEIEKIISEENKNEVTEKNQEVKNADTKNVEEIKEADTKSTEVVNEEKTSLENKDTKQANKDSTEEIVSKETTEETKQVNNDAGEKKVDEKVSIEKKEHSTDNIDEIKDPITKEKETAEELKKEKEVEKKILKKKSTKITEETIELTDPKAVAEALGLNEKKKKEEEPVEIEEEVDLESLETGK